MVSDLIDREVVIPADLVELEGYLRVPEGATGLVVFAHGSGSSRHSPRNRFVAEKLNEEGLATLLFDLLTEEEDSVREARFDIELLSQRLEEATSWVRTQEELKGLNVGYFGSSTGAAAAMEAAAEVNNVKAVVSRGGRVDMVFDVLPVVDAATLLIVGGEDRQVLELNRRCLEILQAEKELEVVEGAGHLFEDEGELEEVAELAAEWFKEHLEDD